MKLLKKARWICGKVEEAGLAFKLALRFFGAVSHGWASDLRDRDEDRLTRVMHVTTNDMRLMRIIRLTKKPHAVIKAVRLIKHDANLLALIEDMRVPQLAREEAIRCLAKDQRTIFILALSRNVMIAKPAAEQLTDQTFIEAVLKGSPHATVRMAAARICTREMPLVTATARDPHEDVRWEASVRYMELCENEQRDYELARARKEQPAKELLN